MRGYNRNKQLNMKQYIVLQMQVDKESFDGNNKNVEMTTIVRKVEADSKELAIGKFVTNTQDIKAIKKLNIQCYDLDELKSA